MSAECMTCGFDLIYGDDEDEDMYCLVCSLNEEIETLRNEVTRWKNIAESRLGDERKYLGKFRGTLRAMGDHPSRCRAERRRLTLERDALKEALGYEESLRIIRSITEEDRDG